MTDLNPVGLRVVLAVAETGSFTAAARLLGYSQPAVSRQVAALEAVTGRQLFERQRGGVRLTAAGTALLPRARHIIDELAAAVADARLEVRARVRLGTFPIAAATILPQVLAQLRSSRPDMIVTLREATTPALVRSVRAGTLDLALVAQSLPYRPLDSESPPLHLTNLIERNLVVAVGAGHPLARHRTIDLDQLAGHVWVASGNEGGDSLMGVWPGLPERAEVRYVVRDWLAKLQIVAAGLAITTIPPSLTAQRFAGVRYVSVRGESQETRRLSLVRLPGTLSTDIADVVDLMRELIG